MTATKSFTPDAGVLSAMLITFSVATILLIFRLVSRKITHVTLWWDDYFAIISWVSCCLVKDKLAAYFMIYLTDFLQIAACLYFSFAMYCRYPKDNRSIENINILTMFQGLL